MNIRLGSTALGAEVTSGTLRDVGGGRVRDQPERRQPTAAGEGGGSHRRFSTVSCRVRGPGPRWTDEAHRCMAIHAHRDAVVALARHSQPDHTGSAAAAFGSHRGGRGAAANAGFGHPRCCRADGSRSATRLPVVGSRAIVFTTPGGRVSHAVQAAPNCRRDRVGDQRPAGEVAEVGAAGRPGWRTRSPDCCGCAPRAKRRRPRRPCRRRAWPTAGRRVAATLLPVKTERISPMPASVMAARMISASTSTTPRAGCARRGGAK